MKLTTPRFTNVRMRLFNYMGQILDQAIVQEPTVEQVEEPENAGVTETVTAMPTPTSTNPSDCANCGGTGLLGDPSVIGNKVCSVCLGTGKAQ